MRRRSRRKGSSPRAAMPPSLPMRHTRCTCRRTSSRAWARGRNRWPPTCVPPRWRGPPAIGPRPTTRATMPFTRTCSSGATTRRGSRWKRRCAFRAATRRHRHSPMPRPRCPRAWPWSAATGRLPHSSSPSRARCRSPKPSHTSLARSARREAAMWPRPRRMPSSLPGSTSGSRPRRTRTGRLKWKCSASPWRDGSRRRRGTPRRVRN